MSANGKGSRRRPEDVKKLEENWQRTFEKKPQPVFEAAPSPGLPYPWCFQPSVCRGRGSCPRAINCGD